MGRLVSFAIALSLLALPACKKEQKKGPAPTPAPRVAPAPPTKAKQLAGRKKPKADDDWRNTRLDAQPPNRKTKTPAKTAKTDQKDGGPMSDAELQARKIATARTLDEKTLDARLNSASRRLGACMRKSGAKQMNADVRIRVHRSGYVMSATATGVPTAVQTCISNTLSTMRLGALRSGEGLTVKRTFKLFDKSKVKPKKPAK